MKILLSCIALLMITGCEPDQMSDAEAVAFKSCLDKGWHAQFKAGGSYRRLSCSPDNLEDK
jgi:hypothetical protein